MCLARPLISKLDAGVAEYFDSQLLANPGDKAIALQTLAIEQARNAHVGIVVEVAEGQILELPLQVADTEPVRERRVDIKDIASHEFASLLVVLDRADRTGALGELDQSDAHIVDHGHEHLADIVSLPSACPSTTRHWDCADPRSPPCAEHRAPAT
jgi:hypothetical protein